MRAGQKISAPVREIPILVALSFSFRDPFKIVYRVSLYKCIGLVNELKNWNDNYWTKIFV
jgi:hypothetical protein